ncbi:MAG: hypothetical protein ACK5Q5_19520 [Planctomycetaceae bacterium]
MTNPLRRPWILFGLLAAGALLLAVLTHRFQAHTEPDSNGYLQFDWSSLAACLSNIRTWGYPLFLKIVYAVSPNRNAVAVAHWLCWLGAALALYRGLVAAGGRELPAAWAGGILLYGPAALTFTPAVLADSLATSLTVGATSAFLATNLKRPRAHLWGILAVTSCAAWIVRPACLFLIPLWPMLSTLMTASYWRHELGWRGVVRRGAIAAAATVLPFLVYCCLRWTVVGHWGLVSFGGYNIVGVTGQFLELDDVERLSVELQPLARELIRRRQLQSTIVPPTDFVSMENSYSPAIWQWIVPTTHAVVGDDVIQVNAVLNRLSVELMKMHRAEYLRWLLWNSQHAARQAFNITLHDRGVILLGVLLITTHFWSLIRRRYESPPARIVISPRESFVENHLLLWTALAFAAAKSLLVILVEPAIGRYMIAATVLFPSVLGLWTGCYLEQVMQPSERTDEPCP